MAGKIVRRHSDTKIWRLLIILVLLIFIGFLTFGNIQLMKKRAGLNQEMSKLKNQLEEINVQIKANSAKITPDNSSASLEKAAREELNLMKAGESVVAFPEKIESEVDKTEGLLQKIKDKPK